MVLVRKLSSVTVERFSYELLHEENLSPKTVKDILIILNSIINYTQKCTSSVQQSIEVMYPKVPKTEIRVLSTDEQARFIKYLLCNMDKCKFGVLLSLITGMRIGEICALRWGNISLEDKIIKVCSTMQRIKNYDENSKTKTKIVISNPKSEASSRIIPLPESCVNICKNYWCDNPSAYVLTGKTDQYIEPRTMQHKLETYVAESGLPTIHFHTLRHTFATRCVEVDFEIKSLSEILGHSSPRITLERYVHSSIELKRKNMAKLNTLL